MKSAIAGFQTVRDWGFHWINASLDYRFWSFHQKRHQALYIQLDKSLGLDFDFFHLSGYWL
jgi:hypothetical protein